MALLAERERTATLVERVAAQTLVRLAGEVPDGSIRVVSHDPDAPADRRLLALEWGVMSS